MKKEKYTESRKAKPEKPQSAIGTRLMMDDEVFSDSFLNLLDAVLGTRLSNQWKTNSMALQEAMNIILHSMGLKQLDIPQDITDINEQIESVTRPYGVMSRAVRLKGKWWKDAAGAMLGTFKADGSPVALIRDSFSGYKYWDSKTGKFCRINRKNASLLEEEAMVFYHPFRPGKLNISSLFEYVRKNISVASLLILLFVSVFITLLGMVSPAVNKLLFSNIFENEKIQPLAATLTFLAGVSISQIMLQIYRSLTEDKILFHLRNSIHAASFGRMLLLPANFLRKYSAGNLSYRLQSLNTLIDSVVSSVLNIGLTSLLSLIYIGQITHYALPLVIPALLIILLSCVFSVVTALVQIKVSRREMELGSKETGMSYAIINTMSKIKAAGAEKRMFARWANVHAKRNKEEYHQPLFLRLNSTISIVISALGTLLIYSIALKEHISVSDYYAFNSAYGMVTSAFISLTQMVLTVSRIKPVYENAKPLLDEVPEVSVGRKMVTHLDGKIEMTNVSYRYDANSPYIVRNMSLTINPNEYVAVVGKTGCGKSTWMKLLLGFLKPETGSIYYDGRDMNSLDMRSLRRKLGVVIQDGKLFSGDLYSNITICAPWLTLDEAWDAAEKAGIAEDIRNMPMQMNTMVMEGDNGLSGGQKQRLLIARAIAPKPRVLLFDEATSALDNVTQKLVSESLNNLNCTRIVIAHRLSTIRQCSRILVFDDGRIVQDGTYDELMAQDGLFKELAARQTVEEK